MKRNIWWYGLAMGLLLLVLQVTHYQTLIRNTKIEIFGLIVAIIFMGLGTWLGLNLYRRQQNRISNKRAKEANKLSSRELDVLLLLADGDSNQEIADKLFVSLNTIKTHISNIYQKLGVKRRTQAIQKAQQFGIISSSESMN